jgi:translocation and assembly module TamB
MAPQISLQASAERLRISNRPDQRLSISGQAEAKLQGQQLQVRGNIRADEALFLLPDDLGPQLGSDVVVRGAPGSPNAGQPRELRDERDARTRATPQAGGRVTKLAITLDMGNDFRVRGKGIDTGVGGTLTLAGDSLAAPRLIGTVSTVGGTYRAYGQRLNIEQGVLRFTGPLDNPALDILAIRPNLTQRVGVQILGTALLPQVRLYSQPELPDAEKLSWLVVGRASASGGAEAALLQQAAVALLGSRAGGDSGGLAASLGLDELSFSRGNGSNGTVSGGAITLGKRFSSNFYAAYESSLSGALGTLLVFYELSQRLTLRAQAGSQTAIDLIYTVPYD